MTDMREVWQKAVAETNRLQRELDITSADHIALWLEANTIPDEPMSQCASWLAVQIVEAHERALFLMQPEIDRRVAEERAKLLERFDEDALEEIISDSLEMDWRPRDAARAIIAQFEKENSDG